jgi:hypothetical protein
MKVVTQFVIEDDERIPEEMAEKFARMDNWEQARFFNALAESVDAWPKHPGMQWLAVGNWLNDHARRLVGELYDHTRNSSHT